MLQKGKILLQKKRMKLNCIYFYFYYSTFVVLADVGTVCYIQWQSEMVASKRHLHIPVIRGHNPAITRLPTYTQAFLLPKIVRFFDCSTLKWLLWWQHDSYNFLLYFCFLQLFELLGFDRFELIQSLLQNREKLLYETIEVESKPSVNNSEYSRLLIIHSNSKYLENSK